jgi:hypothetical protein
MLNQKAEFGYWYCDRFIQQAITQIFTMISC